MLENQNKEWLVTKVFSTKTPAERRGQSREVIAKLCSKHARSLEMTY